MADKKYKYEQPTTYTPTTYDPTKGIYANDIAKAQAEYDAVKAAKPAAYQSQYSNQIGNVINTLNNRKFNYDVNSDAMFQQLKSLYNEQGKLAMADTQGQAAALTGGYGNSYGVAASQQAYQKAQEQLYDRIPELYQLALSRYQQEGNDLNNMYSILANQENADYGKYRDAVSDYNNERSFSENALNTLRNLGQNLWAQEESNAASANNQAWNNYWQAEQMNENARQFNEQMNYNYSRGSGSSGGSGGGSSSYSDELDMYKQRERMDAMRTKLDKMKMEKPSQNTLAGALTGSITNALYNTSLALIKAELDKDKTLSADEKAILMREYGLITV